MAQGPYIVLTGIIFMIRFGYQLVNFRKPMLIRRISVITFLRYLHRDQVSVFNQSTGYGLLWCWNQYIPREPGQCHSCPMCLHAYVGIVLFMLDKPITVFQKEVFQLPVASHWSEIRENTKDFSVFPEQFSTGLNVLLQDVCYGTGSCSDNSGQIWPCL